MKKWDIDWKKLGHAEPKVFKTTFPQQGGEFPQVSDEDSVSILTADSHETRADSNRVEPLRPSQQAPERTAPLWPSNIAPPERELEDEANDNDHVNAIDEDKDMLASKERLSDTSVGAIHAPKPKSSVRTEKLHNDNSTRRRGRDLSSGLELLELDFLLSIVENVNGEEPKDVSMRKINFNELIRRSQLHEVDSNALKVYALNEKDLYGKDIQLEAVKELCERTTSKR